VSASALAREGALGGRERDLVADAATWRLLAKLFERPRPGWLEEIGDLAAEVDDPGLRGAVEAARGAAEEGFYLALLGPGGAVSPREVAHRGPMVQPGLLLARLNALYGAFAYHPETEEVPDHLAVEVGFMAFLRLKEAYARARGEEEQAAQAATAADHLLEEHLRAMAEPVAEVLEAAGGAYLARAARALLERTGPRPEALRAPTLGRAGTGEEEDGCGWGCSILDPAS